MHFPDQLAKEHELSLGLVFPLEAYTGSVPDMKNQESLAKSAEQLGFKALWFRDVPFHDPSFGDAGQMFDPWIYMAHIMNQTETIFLGTASVILPLRHPVHIKKSINSLQNLSGGRIIAGIASGDRPLEYPAFNKQLDNKSELFRESFYFLNALDEDFPKHASQNFGLLSGQLDILPKSKFKTPYLVTGHSGQTIDWIGQYADGWLYYPRNFYFLKDFMHQWQMAYKSHGHSWKPFMQSLYIDLVSDQKAQATPIHLGFRCGTEFLKNYLNQIKDIGVNHVILNLKFNQRPIKETLEHLAKDILPSFH